MMLCMTQVPENKADGGSPRLLTVGQVAEVLQVSPETVRNWAYDGKIACITLPSGQRRFRAEVVDAILSGETTTAGAA